MQYCDKECRNVHILLVEDNRIISKGLVYTLKSNGHEVTLCEDCESAVASSGGEYDLMILDVTLPDGNGFELFKEIRRLNQAPAIFLTALDDEDNIVSGLELGADDYITKPFSTRELLARIKRFDNASNGKGSILTVGDISVDTEKHIVMKNGAEAELTALEYRILIMLMQNAGQVVTRERILEKIWDIAGNFVNDNTLTVYIKRIRQKLDTELIRTVKGIGYRMEAK